MILEQQKVLQQFGITLKESDRYQKVGTLAGTRLAEYELEQNLKSYEREFLMDEALSLPHTYHHLNGELYSQPIPHPLFNIKNQIDRREREGLTLEGFTRFENLVVAAKPDSVTVWYSPDGPSGFEGIHYDSGRLYVNFKTSVDSSVNFDLKVHPRFPIVPLLGAIHEQTDGIHPYFDSPESGKKYYLTHPIKTNMDVNDFFHFMNQRDPEETTPLYISRRNSQEPMLRSLLDAVEEMKQMLEYQNTHGTDFVFESSGDKTTHALMKQEDLMRRYMAVIDPYVKQNNGTYTLYGCSTTSTVNDHDMAHLIGQHSIDSLISLYSTERRMLTDNPDIFKQQQETQTSFPCPKCGEPIPYGKGYAQCPHCGITKEQYAKEAGTPVCG